MAAPATSAHLRAVLSDVAAFSRLAAAPAGGAVPAGAPHGLRPYQEEAARAVVAAIRAGQGDTLTVMMARQMGKNELSARLEAYLLTLYAARGGQVVKTAPSMRPQLLYSKQRLEAVLSAHPLTAGRWQTDRGIAIRIGSARVLFLSAGPTAHVLGGTASLLLEVDEAQDVHPDLYSRVLRPMAASTNAPSVLYGTAWTDETLLETARAFNRERQLGLGRRLHFEYPWRTLASLNPAYGAFVEAEIARLGAAHPIIQTQYELRTLSGLGRFLSPEQRALLQGRHDRCAAPQEGECYVAGVDIAGEDEEAADAALRSLQPRRDSTVITIGRVHWDTAGGEPALEVVEHVWWTGKQHADQFLELRRLLGDVWSCRKIIVDATGVGAGVASWLERSLGPDLVEQVVFTAPEKSRLAYRLLGMVNTGRCQLYRRDGSPEYAQFWTEAAACRYELRAQEQMRFYVPAAEGHDDFVVSLALCARAAYEAVRPSATVMVRPRQVMW